MWYQHQQYERIHVTSLHISYFLYEEENVKTTAGPTALAATTQQGLFIFNLKTIASV